MKFTSNEANKLLKSYQSELAELVRLSNQSSTYVAAITENLDEACPEFDFLVTETRIIGLQNKIRKIKHAINVFNSSTVIESIGMTIDEALVALPQFNSCLARYQNLKGRLPKTRKTDFRPGNAQIEYEYLNYELADVKQLYEETNAKIIKIQTGLDLVNNTIQFEIDI